MLISSRLIYAVKTIQVHCGDWKIKCTIVHSSYSSVFLVCVFFVFFSAQFQKLNTIFRNYALAEAPPSYRLFLLIALSAVPKRKLVVTELQKPQLMIF